MFIKICALALISSCAALLLRHISGSLSFGVKLASCVLITSVTVVSVEPMLSELLSIADGGGRIVGYAQTVFRGLGVAILAQMTSQICRECGESSAANGVELAAKFEIFILCMPLIGDIMQCAVDILNMR